MRGEVSDAIESGVLKPIRDLRGADERDTDEYKDGLVLGGEISDNWCNVVNMTRVQQIQKRVEFSNYLIVPTKFGFQKLVRVLSIVMSFIGRCRKSKPILEESESRLKFSMFHSLVPSATVDSNLARDPSKLVSHFLGEDAQIGEVFAATQLECSGPGVIKFTDAYIRQALHYLYVKAAKEVQHFYPKQRIEKIALMKDGILVSRGRILEGMNFVQTGGLELRDLQQLSIHSHIPVIDRYSPLAYSIATHIHWDVAKHKGIETCNRLSLEHVSIIQGASLYKELGEQCIRCKIRRKKFLESPMGPISNHQLGICPPFWATQADLFGPVKIYVPGFTKNTRTRNVLDAKCWVMVFVCPVSRLVNLQVIEKSDSSGMVDGITRLSCEVGVPKYMMIDGDSALVKVMKEVTFDIKDASLKLQREYGIEFSICPVAGHQQHGQVERKIRTVQSSLKEAGLHSMRLHATGLQTLLKLVENQLNNLPIGYTYGRDQDNTSLLKMLVPNMLRVGRSNMRALDGPMRMPSTVGELLVEVQKIYDCWFKIWNVSYLPKLMQQPKWF